MQLVRKISKAGLSWEILHFNVNMPSSIFCVDMTTTRMMWSVQRLYQVRHEYCQTHSPLPVLFLMEPHDGTSGDHQERPWMLLQDAPCPPPIVLGEVARWSIRLTLVDVIHKLINWLVISQWLINQFITNKLMKLRLFDQLLTLRGIYVLFLEQSTIFIMSPS